MSEDKTIKTYWNVATGELWVTISYCMALIFHEDNYYLNGWFWYCQVYRAAFKMYGGPITDVTIEVEDSLMGAV